MVVAIALVMEKAMAVLYLPLNAMYYDAIVAGEKLLEYRENTTYWRKRLEGREFEAIEIMKGYPKKGDISRRTRRAWRGWVMKKITHEHFGDKPVEVFAIDVSVPL